MAKDKEEDLRAQVQEYFDIFPKVDVVYVVKTGSHVFIKEEKAKEYSEKIGEKYIPVKR